jgi:hypothetical protein
MTVKDYQEGKLIILSKSFDNRAKILNVFYFFVFTAAGIGFTGKMLDGNSLTVPLGIFLFAMVGVFLFAGYKFVNKALYSERILINKNNLTIIKTGLTTQKNSYDNTLISNFRHLDIQEPTKHALAGQTFDYLGFQTEQAVINNMHGNDRLAFDYDGKTIKFGENVYTWDFEELNIVLFDVTEKDFRYHESYEKSFKLEDENEENDDL